MSEDDEQVIFPCCYCFVPILTFWEPNGGLCSGEYILAGDEVFHPKCYGWCFEEAE